MSSRHPPITIEADGAAALAFRKLASQFPKEAKEAGRYAGEKLAVRLRQAVSQGGGRWGVPRMAPHHPVSKILRPNNKMFGQLSEARTIPVFAGRRAVYVGWHNRYAKWAKTLQDAQQRSMSKKQRHFLYVLAARKGHDIHGQVDEYDRQARPVIEPFAAANGRDVPPWILDRLAALIDDTLSEQGL